MSDRLDYETSLQPTAIVTAETHKKSYLKRSISKHYAHLPPICLLVIEKAVPKHKHKKSVFYFSSCLETFGRIS